MIQFISVEKWVKCTIVNAVDQQSLGMCKILEQWHHNINHEDGKKTLPCGGFGITGGKKKRQPLIIHSDPIQRIFKKAVFHLNAKIPNFYLRIAWRKREQLSCPIYTLKRSELTVEDLYFFIVS